MVFPEGIRYNRQKDSYRTFRVNSIFTSILLLQKDTEENKNGTNANNKHLSHLVAGTGLPDFDFLPNQRFLEIHIGVDFSSRKFGTQKKVVLIDNLFL